MGGISIALRTFVGIQRSHVQSGNVYRTPSSKYDMRKGRTFTDRSSFSKRFRIEVLLYLYLIRRAKPDITIPDRTCMDGICFPSCWHSFRRSLRVARYRSIVSNSQTSRGGQVTSLLKHLACCLLNRCPKDALILRLHSRCIEREFVSNETRQGACRSPFASCFEFSAHE